MQGSNLLNVSKQTICLQKKRQSFETKIVFYLAREGVRQPTVSISNDHCQGDQKEQFHKKYSLSCTGSRNLKARIRLPVVFIDKCIFILMFKAAHKNY